MAKSATTFLLVFILSACSVSSQAQPLLRSPAISSDASQIAFSYQGDIWKANVDGSNAIRLTVHAGNEGGPVWSPKGNQIAFSGNRYGNADVFVIDANGSNLKRVTFHPSGDQAMDWMSDDELLVAGSRSFRKVERGAEFLKASLNNSTPERLLNSLGYNASVSPSGKYIAFQRGSCRQEREDYKGPADHEIWLFNTESKSYHQLTNNEVQDLLPDWIDDKTLVFLSSESGRYNVHQHTLENNELKNGKQITNFKVDGIRHFDVSGNGTFILERKSHISIFKDGNEEILNISLPTSARYDEDEFKSYSNGVGDYSISPNGKYAAIEIHGEIYVKLNEKEKSKTVNVSKHAYRDQNPTWINDTTLLFISDRDGQKDIYKVISSDEKKVNLFESLKHEVSRITNTKEEENNIIASPDGKNLAFQRGRGDLLLAEFDGKLKNEKKLNDGWNSANGLQWSPDSKWIAYAQSDLNFNSEIYIQATDGASKTNVSMHPRADRSPVWSADGSKLGFVSNRSGNDYDIWFVWLKEEDWEKTKPDHEEGYYFDEEEKKEEDEKDKKKEKEVEPIIIDLVDIHDRLVRLTSMNGNESNLAFSSDGELVFFTARQGSAKGSDVYSIKYDRDELKQLTKSGQSPYALQMHKKELYALKKGSMAKVGTKDGKVTSLPHKASLKIDHQAERKQVYEEVWRSLRDGFYDPEFHGYNFANLKKKYEPWCLAASNSQDFRYMVNAMLGQLNASHMGLYGSDTDPINRQRGSLLGIEVKAHKNGLEITRVVPDGPADRKKSNLNIGDIISEVDGESLVGNNLYDLLRNRSGDQVLLSLKTQGEEKEIVIRPTSSLSTQLYEEWVAERQRLTEEYSNGRLGYIHIRGMNMQSFERFERELTASGLGKEGIVIDVRFNGGGWTTDYLMAVLNVKQHSYTIPRGATSSLKNNKKFDNYYPFSERLPLSWLTKPSVAMCNEASYSNAEIFSHAYKALGHGKLVGKPTFGAVISTGGQGLLDGSFVRMPFRAWYVKESGMNMEHGPAVPDYDVDNSPDANANGLDQQLKKAVEVLLEDLD